VTDTKANSGNSREVRASYDAVLTAQQSRIREALLPTAFFAGVITLMAVMHNLYVAEERWASLYIIVEGITCLLFTSLALGMYYRKPSLKAAPPLMTLLLILGQSCLVAEMISWPDMRQAAYFSLIAVAMGSLMLIPVWLGLNLFLNSVLWYGTVALLIDEPNWILWGMFHAVAVAIAMLVGSARIRTVHHLTEVRVREHLQRRELAKARDALALADDRFQSLLNAVDDIVWSSSLDGDELYFISPAAEAISGIPLAEFYASPGVWLQCVHPEDREAVEQDWKRLPAEDYINLEYRFTNAENEVRWIQDRRRVVFDEAGAPVRIGGIARDITERKKTEEEALRSRELMAHAERIAHVGSWEWTPVTGEVTWSEGMGAILEMEPEECPKTIEAVMALIHPEDRAIVEDAMRMSVELGQTRPLEYRALLRDGSVRHLWAVGKVLHDTQGNILQVYGSVQDITLRKHAEAERRALEARLTQSQKQESLGTLAGGIAHDFNNMLMGILGNVSVARLIAADNAALQTPLAHIERSAERAAQMSRQMLTYSGRVVLRKKRVDINTIVSAICEEVSALAGDHIRIVHQLGIEDATCEVDEKEVRQGITNLVLNGLEALTPGKGSITLRTQRTMRQENELREMLHATDAAPGPYLTIEVEDTGHGVRPEDIPRLFDPFYSSKGMGRGLGLASVLGIARSHGGAIDVVSHEGEGTCFRLHLPLTTEASKVDDTGEDFRGDNAPHNCVLVIDDEAALLDSVKLMLQHLGHSCITAPGGQEGIEMYHREKNRIGLVILDLTMPDMSGKEVLVRLREENPNLPIVMSSGYPEDCDALIEAHPALGFLQKPYRMNDLEDAVRLHLDPANDASAY
jgi:PAS domain S-box-containing protein